MMRGKRLCELQLKLKSVPDLLASASDKRRYNGAKWEGSVKGMPSPTHF